MTSEKNSFLMDFLFLKPNEDSLLLTNLSDVNAIDKGIELSQEAVRPAFSDRFATVNTVSNRATGSGDRGARADDRGARKSQRAERETEGKVATGDRSKLRNRLTNERTEEIHYRLEVGEKKVAVVPDERAVRQELVNRRLEGRNDGENLLLSRVAVNLVASVFRAILLLLARFGLN